MILAIIIGFLMVSTVSLVMWPFDRDDELPHPSAIAFLGAMVLGVMYLLGARW